MNGTVRCLKVPVRHNLLDERQKMFKSGSEAQSASKAQSLGWTAQLDVYWHGRKQTMANNGHSKQSKKLFAMLFIQDSMMNLKTIPYFFLCKYVVWSLVVAQSITACLFKAVTFFRKIPWYPTFLEFSLITETLAIFFYGKSKKRKEISSLFDRNEWQSFMKRWPNVLLSGRLVLISTNIFFYPVLHNLWCRRHLFTIKYRNGKFLKIQNQSQLEFLFIRTI